MMTQKVTLDIKVETLDIQSAKSLIQQFLYQLDMGSEQGMLNCTDGDKIQWATSRKDLAL